MPGKGGVVVDSLPIKDSPTLVRPANGKGGAKELGTGSGPIDHYY